MDIDILLILQEFRNSIGDALTPFMEWLSLFAVTYLPVVPALIYWTSSKKKGLFPLADKDYTKKYKWFRRLTNSKIGLAFLMRTLPLIKRER